MRIPCSSQREREGDVERIGQRVDGHADQEPRHQRSRRRLTLRVTAPFEETDERTGEEQVDCRDRDHVSENPLDAVKTDRWARSARLAPSRWPTRIDTAWPMPSMGKNATMFKRTVSVVAPVAASPSLPTSCTKT